MAAGQGAISEAITILLSAAERAGAKGQFAAEVICLQTATQFGDRSGAPRLRELEAIVEGPRVGLAARFAEALRDGDAAELAAVSEDFERMGDLVAAVDAAAHAAIAYRHQDLRGSALGCSTRADALAQQCGGADTPALRQASEQLPLTDRELEIVMLIADGVSNREVAERLTLSVRTVESHIYRAMSKTGTTSRDELANLLHRRRREHDTSSSAPASSLDDRPRGLSIPRLNPARLQWRATGLVAPNATDDLHCGVTAKALNPHTNSEGRTMKNILVTSLTAGALAVAALGLTATANAARPAHRTSIRPSTSCVRRASMSS